VESYLYDHLGGGRLTAVVDENGHATSYAYDFLGRRVTQTDAAGNKLAYVYDADDRVVTRVRLDYDGTNYVTFKTAYLYDDLGRVTKSTDQGADGDITQTTDNRSMGLWFDALGRVPVGSSSCVGR